jgi:hypothetical protein
MIPLLGFAALGVDIAGGYVQRQQLQTGADAAAFAIAQQCGRGACGSTGLTAQKFATANLNSTTSTATVTNLTSSAVTVSNAGIRQHLFAPVLGIHSTAIDTTATVVWGSPTGGTAMLPLAFSLCEWKAQTGGGMPSGTTERTIYLTKSSASATDCTGPSGNLVPGGFGWLTTDSGTCHTTSTINGVLHSDPGNSVPSTCAQTDLTAALNRTVLLPIFDQVAGTGSGATYRMYGYAAFVVTGFHFGGQNNYNDPCTGNNRCVRGYFARFVDLSEAFDFGAGAPQLGSSIIKMTE